MRRVDEGLRSGELRVRRGRAELSGGGSGSGGGDCIDYLVQHRGIGFMEALRTLAAETGVPVPGWSPEQVETEARRIIDRARDSA